MMMMYAGAERALHMLRRYYDVTEGNGALAREGERVVVHYEARWKGVTFMTSRWGHGCAGVAAHAGAVQKCVRHCC